MNSRGTIVALVVVAVVVIVLAAGVPHDSFFAGDPGVKLIAARAAAAHPMRPLDVDIPVIGQERLPFLEPFFPVHADHAHAATSQLFVILSAPLIAAFGISGGYILPVLGFIGTIIGCAWLAVALDTRRVPALTVAVTAICTPFLFYGVEFWEHTAALACASLGGALLLTGTRAGIGRSVAAGIMLAIAVLLRPEALWFVVAIAAALPMLHDRPPARTLVTALLAFCVSLAPMIVYAMIHFGSPFTPHISGNEGLLSRNWFAIRESLVGEWFNPLSNHVDIWSVAPAVALVFVPVPASEARNGRAFLATVGVVYGVLVLATAPNDGGAQWGPRYLLFAYIPLMIIVTDVLAWLVTRRRLSMIAIIAVGWSVWIDRTAYRDLRTTKVVYGRIANFVEKQSAEDQPIVTDLWWLDQVCARLSDRRVFLYASQPNQQKSLIGSLSRVGTRDTVIIRSDAESATSAREWIAGTCYEITAKAAIPERRLLAIHLRRDCSTT